MIYMEERHEQIMRDVLKKYPYTFYVFGSRARGDHKNIRILISVFLEIFRGLCVLTLKKILKNHGYLTK